MTTNNLRWGILGTADIARKNWLGIRNSGNGTVVALASRDLKRARKFVQYCQAHAPMPAAPRVYGSYAELLADASVEAVYIPLPTALRKEWVLRAAAVGKHVVCEKPCAATATDLQEIIRACRRHRVQFMDGVMFMHSRRLQAMREALDSPKLLGPVRRVTSAFSFRAPPQFYRGNIRADPALEPQGCLGDLGWYCIRFSLWAMNWQVPQQVTARILAQTKHPGQSKPILTEFSAELSYPEGVSAAFFCSFLAQNQEWAHVSGSRGYLRLEDFVMPFDGPRLGFEMCHADYVKSGCEFKMTRRLRRATISEHSQAHSSAQESNLFRAFADQVRAGRLNPDWPDWALKTQTVMDACLEAAEKSVSIRVHPW